MAGKRDQSRQRTLRRYALAGNLKAVRRILLQQLEANPDDRESRDELERLDKGLPLRVCESAKQRRARKATEADAELRRIIQTYPESSLPSANTEKLLRLRRFLQESTSTLRQAAIQESPVVSQYRKALQRECRRRGVGRLRRFGMWGLLLVAVAALPTGIGVLCHKRAHDLERELSRELKSAHAEKVQNLILVADTSINRLFCPELEDDIRDANAWLAEIKRRKRELEKHIERIEKGNGTISGMRLSLRAEIERNLAVLPEDYRELELRWNKLCKRESSVLAQQKAALVHELSEPLPPMPEFTGICEQDSEALRNYRHSIQQRVARFKEAPASYKLSPKLVAPMQQQLSSVRVILSEIEAYEGLLSRLRHIRTYEQYRHALQGFSAPHYPPATQLLSICERLPEEENVRSLMRDPKRQSDEKETAAAIQTLLENGPTFTSAYPATWEQTSLMEEIFKAPSLERLLIEATNAEGQRCITESKPSVDAQFRVYLRRSDLDPAATASNRNVCWEDAHSVLLRTIDARPLLRELQLDKSNFFSTGNIPQLLTKVLNFEHRHCPALAQALVYHRLLLLVYKHPAPMLTGRLYSPTMRQHAASFSKLLAKHPELELRSGCWLENSPHILAAEKDFSSWFHRHKGADYPREIRAQFGSLMQVGVKFCGYIDSSGEPRLFRKVEENSTIWYISEGGLQATPLCEASGNATPLSPVFTAIR